MFFKITSLKTRNIRKCSSSSVGKARKLQEAARTGRLGGLSGQSLAYDDQVNIVPLPYIKTRQVYMG